MKEISEEWQLKLFDLLEGNLSEAESAQLLIEIETHANLFREYKLLQSTYLTPDETEVFEFKHKLLKPTKKGFIIPFHPLKYAAAASFVLLSSILGYVYFTGRQKPHSNQWVQKPRHSTPAHDTTPNPLTEPQITSQASAPAIQAPDASKYTPAQPPIFKDSVAETSKPLVQNPVNITGRKITANSILAENSNLSTYRIWVYYPVEGPVSGTKKRTLSYKLLNTTRTMLATLNFPSISVKTKPVKGHILPAFNIRVQLPQNENNTIANYTE